MPRESDEKAELGAILLELLIALDELPYLGLPPGPEYLKTLCAQVAGRLRERIDKSWQEADAVAAGLPDVIAQCEKLAEALSARQEAVWGELERASLAAREGVADLRRRLVGDFPPDPAQRSEAIRAITTAARRARRLADRFHSPPGSRRWEDQLREASALAADVLRLSYDDWPILAEEDRTLLRDAAMSLHLLRFHAAYLHTWAPGPWLQEQLAADTAVLEAVAGKLA